MSEVIQNLHEAINGKDLKKTTELLEQMHDTVLTDSALSDMVVQPAVITKLHQRLSEEFDIPARAMQIRKKPMTRPARALMFVKGMLNGVRKVK